MKSVYIGIGSNLDNPLMQIHEAVDRLKAIPGVQLQKLSSLYHSKPMGQQDQPDFINAVAAIEMNLSADVLLTFLRRIESAQGRVRTEKKRWGSRTIDLDILLFGDEIIHTNELIIPHPGLQEREFVVYPLAEIAPQLVLPTGESIADIKAHCPERTLRVVTVEHSEEKQ